MNRRLMFAILGAAVAVGSVTAMAAEDSTDPLVLAPDKYTTLLDNDRVRVLDLKLKAGESIPMHSHPDHFVYVLSGGTITLTHPDGTAADVVAEKGQVLWIPAESHAALNKGATDVHLIVNELK